VDDENLENLNTVYITNTSFGASEEPDIICFPRLDIVNLVSILAVLPQRIMTLKK